MGLFDRNIHMNGAGTKYEAFLRLAAAAENKGAKIGGRTVRLVKAGNGLATTTSHTTEGARADQIADARKAFLDTIEREFGIGARWRAEQVLGRGAQNAKPLTARTIRQVADALGDTNALARERAPIIQNLALVNGAIESTCETLCSRLGLAAEEIDRQKIEKAALGFIRKKEFENTADGLREAVEKATAYVALSMCVKETLESRKDENGNPAVPASVVDMLVREIVVNGGAAELLNDMDARDDNFQCDLDRLVSETIAKAKPYIEKVRMYEKLSAEVLREQRLRLESVFGPNALADDPAKQVLDMLRRRINEKHPAVDIDARKTLFSGNAPRRESMVANFKDLVNQFINTAIVRHFAKELLGKNGDGSGNAFFDALGLPAGPRPTGESIDSLDRNNIVLRLSRLDADLTTVENMRLAAKKLIISIGVEAWTSIQAENEKAKPAGSQRPRIDYMSVGKWLTTRVPGEFVRAGGKREVVALAEKYKTILASEFTRIYKAVVDIETAHQQVKDALKAELSELAAKCGIAEPTPQMLKKMEDIILKEVKRVRSKAHNENAPATVEDYKNKILSNVRSEVLKAYGEAAEAVNASTSLNQRQKTAIMSRILEEGEIRNAELVRMALRMMDGVDVTALADAINGRNAKTFCERLENIVFGSHEWDKLTEAEKKALKGADDVQTYEMLTIEILFIMKQPLQDAIGSIPEKDRGQFVDAIKEEANRQYMTYQGKVLKSNGDKYEEKINSDHSRSMLSIADAVPPFFIAE